MMEYKMLETIDDEHNKMKFKNHCWVWSAQYGHFHFNVMPLEAFEMESLNRNRNHCQDYPVKFKYIYQMLCILRFK
jgi:hypothetical protein